MAAHLRHAMQQRPSYVGPVVVIAIVVIVGALVAASYNALVSLGQAVDAQWGQVQNVYQRRADLDSQSRRDRQRRGRLRIEHVRSGCQGARQRRSDFRRTSCKTP